MNDTDDLATAQAVALAGEIEQRLADDPDLTANEECGDLLADGFHLLRLGAVVRLATWAGSGAFEFPSAAAAKRAFASLRPA